MTSTPQPVGSRYLAYGWHVVRLYDVDDLAAVDDALAAAAAETERPSIVITPEAVAAKAKQVMSR